jgi:hypothetical protein
MRKLLTLLVTFSGLSVATLGHAANGAVDITWGVTCTPIVQNLAPVIGPNSLIASVLGNDQTHSGYEVSFLLSAADRTVPDAWRFDAAGCQGSSFITIAHTPPGTAVKTCPAFSGPVSDLQIKQYNFVEPPSAYASTQIKGLLANAYPSAGGVTSVATTRYFLAQFIFDHTFSVNGAGTPGATCGGLETPLCIVLLQGPRGIFEGSGSKYVTFADGLEHFFDESPNHFLTVNSATGCANPNSVPAENKTWGQIKSQYRN